MTIVRSLLTSTALVLDCEDDELGCLNDPHAPFRTYDLDESAKGKWLFMFAMVPRTRPTGRGVFLSQSRSSFLGRVSSRYIFKTHRAFPNRKRKTPFSKTIRKTMSHAPYPNR